MNASKGQRVKLLAKDEVALLIDLVESNKVVTNKATNATNNQLKEVAWNNIADNFNASVSSCPRRTDQLKLKWENLKKAARKRSAKIRMNQIKTGGGKPDYIPPDDALERVATILGATCEGYSVTFGGDSEIIIPELEVDGCKGEVVVVSGGSSSGDGGIIYGGVGDGNTGVLFTSEREFQHDAIQTTPKAKAKKNFFSTPSGSNVEKLKRKLASEDLRVRIERKAIAAYYDLKKKKLELDIEYRELECKKLTFELEINITK